MSLKLYVWEDVLRDYTAGIVCVLAENEEAAWKVLYEEERTAWWVLQGEPEDRHMKGISPKATRPRCVTEPEAFAVWGGG